MVGLWKNYKANEVNHFSLSFDQKQEKQGI